MDKSDFGLGLFARRLCAALCLASVANFGWASTVSYTGEFKLDNDGFFTQFSVSTAGTVSARSLSYDGGVNSQGSTIVPGGFAPVLSLFTVSGGVLVATAGPGSCAAASGDACFDFEAVAGDYLLYLTQDGNTANGPSLAEGFLHASDPYYTGQTMLGIDQAFVDLYSSEIRRAQWAFDLTTPKAGSVPEPSALWLTALGLLAVSSSRRRQPT
jgi:hypothetical protein